MSRRIIRIPIRVRVTAQVRRTIRLTHTVRTYPVRLHAPTQPLALSGALAEERCEVHHEGATVAPDGKVSGCCAAFIARLKTAYDL